MSMRSTVPTQPGRGGRTRQEDKAACDVNNIIAMHKRGQVSPHVMRRVAEYGFVPALTFSECMQRVREARELFADLPSATRKYFNNDPGRFVEFAADPANVEKLIELDLAVPRPVAEPQKVEVVNPPPPAA